MQWLGSNDYGAHAQYQQQHSSYASPAQPQQNTPYAQYQYAYGHQQRPQQQLQPVSSYPLFYTPQQQYPPPQQQRRPAAAGSASQHQSSYPATPASRAWAPSSSPAAAAPGASAPPAPTQHVSTPTVTIPWPSRADVPDVLATMPSDKLEAYEQLHKDIVGFVAQVELSPEEDAARQRVLDAVADCVQRALRHTAAVEVKAFGSYANGLCTHSSDLDIVAIGAVAPDKHLGYYSQLQKPLVNTLLRNVGNELRRAPDLAITRFNHIQHARVPVIKLTLSSGLDVDLSLGDRGGVVAAAFAREQEQLQPAVRPLVLVLKSILAQNKLNDVSIGGLGGWSLINMVIAHLQMELKAGNPLTNYGQLLHSFLRRYGRDFDVLADAVSVRGGGIIRKGADDYYKQESKLLLFDPLTGREIAGGTHRIVQLLNAFASLEEQLDHAVSFAPLGAALQPMMLLDTVLDVQLAVARESFGYTYPSEAPVKKQQPAQPSRPLPRVRKSDDRDGRRRRSRSRSPEDRAGGKRRRRRERDASSVSDEELQPRAATKRRRQQQHWVEPRAKEPRWRYSDDAP